LRVSSTLPDRVIVYSIWFGLIQFTSSSALSQIRVTLTNVYPGSRIATNAQQHRVHAELRIVLVTSRERMQQSAARNPWNGLLDELTIIIIIILFVHKHGTTNNKPKINIKIKKAILKFSVCLSDRVNKCL